MANPALSEKVLKTVSVMTDDSKMTITGTINKTGILLILAAVGACLGWESHSGVVLIGSMIVGFALSLFIIFKPQRAAYLSQVYAFTEGILMGAISAQYAHLYTGIVANALILTFSCLFLMLALYRFRIIRVTDGLRTTIMLATMAVAVTYLVDMLLSWLWHPVPMINDSTPMGIGFSLLVVGIAAFNLLLDFNLIETAQERGAPKYMEWYGGFALMVTLVWLYLEILRLLGKLNKR